VIDLGGGSSLRFTAGRQWAFRTLDKEQRGSSAVESRESSGVLQSLEAIATLAGGQARTWVAGARFEVESLEQLRKGATVSTTGAPSGSEPPEVPYTRLGSGALYGQLSWKLTDALTFMPGVRGELHLRHGGVFAPRLAVAYRPAQAVTLRVSGGRGFRAPSAKEIGFLFDHSSAGYRLEGNPELKPESSWGVNGDATLVPDRRVTLRIGAFANWVDNLIDVGPEPVAPSTSGSVDTFRYENVGRARTSGVEAQATFRPAAWLRTEAGYAYLWTRDDDNDQPLSGKPPHTVQAAIRADLPWKLELTTRFRAVSSAFLEQGEDPRTHDPILVRALGFQTVDVRLARALWPSAQAYVGVRNVSDVQKDPSIQEDDPTRRDRRPIEGRTVYIGLVAELPLENP
jgi:outer membrane receptor for ferrienterochelin and colicin